MSKPNKSGITPYEFKVLIYPDRVAEKIGFILLSDEERQRRQWAQTRGTLVAVGGGAFKDWPDVATPTVGSHVIFDRYAGLLVDGLDDKEYRLCNDKEVAASVGMSDHVPEGRTPKVLSGIG